MQCGRCGFHNLPGLTTCMKCGSVLTATAPIDVTPPRAGWAKVLRPVSYRLNRVFGFSFPGRIRGVLGMLIPREFLRAQNPIHMILSVVPGLGHLVAGQVDSVWRYLAAWAGLMLGGLFLYGTVPGSMLLGLGIAVHVWIIADAGRVGGLFQSLRSQLIMSLVLFYLVFIGIYAPIRSGAGLFLRGAYSGIDIPINEISQGDYLLFNPRAYDVSPPRRGDIILGFIPRGLVAPGRMFRGGEVLTKVVGLPGETLEFKEGKVTCWKGGNAVGVFDLQELGPSPREGTVEVPLDHFLCLRPFPEADGLIAVENVRGRAFMIYNPLWRRGYIPYQDLSAKNALTQ